MLDSMRFTNDKYFRRAIMCLSAVLLAQLLIGCVSIKVQANKDEASVRKVKRLFVLIQQGDVGRQTYSKELASALQNASTNTPVVTEITIANPVELDESAHRKQMDEFGCDAVLVIKATAGILEDFGRYPTIIYDASLFDPQLKKRLWRAHINNSGPTMVMKRRFREMSESIVRQLKNDGFI
jgi:hypothetical protein